MITGTASRGRVIRIDRVNEVNWDYDRIYRKVSSYALEGEPVRAGLLFDALAKREGRDVQTGLSPREWDWLQWNLGFLKKVVSNKLMSTMMFLARKSQSSSFNIREVAIGGRASVPN